MKKISLILIAFIIFSGKGWSQNELTFKVQYNPETNYNQTVDQTTLTSIKYSGSKDVLKTLKEKGITNPTVTNKKSRTESVIKTGKLTSEKSFPLTMEFIKITKSEGKTEIPDGTIIYGNCTTGNMPTFDSIGTNGISDELKKTILQTVQSLYSQLTFPEKKLKIGEEFSTETPLSIPIAGATIEMVIRTNYKLISINNGIGIFDVSQVYTMKTTITKYTINASGKGKGKLYYNISSNYYVKYQMDSEMKMKMKYENVKLFLNTQSNYLQTTEMIKN